jgi:drug/metabolite transporter (DMT)-like permease
MSTSLPGSKREPRILLGIGFMLLAATFLPVMNGVVQWLSQRYPSEQIIWARITGQLVVMLVLMLPRAGLRVFATRRPGLQAMRSVLQLSATSLYFVAVATVPLGKATTIGFLTPFVVMFAAWPLLGERPEMRRLLAATVAFTGVLIVVRPGGADFDPLVVLILINVVFNALYQVLTRKVAPYDRAETSVLWSALLGSVVMTLMVPFFWVTPANVADAAAFLALGGLAAAGHYCVARAFASGPAAVIAPFHYWQIVGATLMGVVVTGLWPDGWTWAGAAVIVAAGVHLALTEGRRA